jgi:uncharacterized membrane protein YgcG
MHRSRWIAMAFALLVPALVVAVPRAWSQQAADESALLSDADLDEMLAPIALYPDRLLANVLTAACYPDELTDAARIAGDVDAIEASGFEPSVKAVAQIPDAMDMLTQYPDWTAAIGQAFILQSQAVMASVQRLRQQAYDSGALRTTDQQIVVPEGDTIIIEPAEPEIIYVPTYDPQVVYVDDSSDEVAAGLIGFGLGVAAGAIIANNVDCDWYGGGCCWGCGRGRWGHADVDIDVDRNVNIDSNRVRGEAWRPNTGKLDRGLRNGRPNELGRYRGVSAGRAGAGRVPGRVGEPGRVGREPGRVGREPGRAGRAPAARPNAVPKSRPKGMQRSGAPRAKPSIPPTRRPPSAGSRGGSRSPGHSAGRSHRSPSSPSAYHSGRGHNRAASRGASSRGRSHGGHSRGGGRRGGRR